MKIQGNNVTIRPITPTDLDKCLEWFNDPEVCQYLERTLPMYEDEEREYLNSVHKHKNRRVNFVIEDNDGAKPIGTIGISFHWIDRVGQLGIAIGEKSY